jgi:3-oxoacyl-[acyl-carrier protein] reductase
MLLEGRSAVIYGGGGAIGGAVARAFGREGATVFLAGRTMEKLEAVADDIRSAGGAAETAVVDALDADAVEKHAEEISSKAGSLDISMNVITHPATHGAPLWEMKSDDFMDSIEVAVRSSFITMGAAARRMVKQGSGVILAFGGPGDRAAPAREYKLGGTQVAFDGIETLRRQLSVEAGPHGVRVVTLESGGVPGTFPADFEARDTIEEMIASQTLTGRAATLEEVAETAAFAASDKARSMTAATINVSAGALID